jgi:hypothetical protein
MVEERGVIFDKDFLPLHWHEPLDATGVLLPDSTNFADIMWDLREDMYGFAHTHPFGEMLVPSLKDLKAFQGIEQGNGKRYLWPIVTFGGSKIFYFKRQIDLTTNAYQSILPFLTFKQMINKNTLFNELRKRSKT